MWQRTSEGQGGMLAQDANSSEVVRRGFIWAEKLCIGRVEHNSVFDTSDTSLKGAQLASECDLAFRCLFLARDGSMAYL